MTETPLRYGVLPNAANDIPAAILASSGIAMDILQPGASLSDYDAVIGFGRYEGWEIVPIDLPPIAAVLNPTIPPLDQPTILQTIQLALIPTSSPVVSDIPGTEIIGSPRTETANSIREQLANAGYPDGITLYGWKQNEPGLEDIIEALALANIRWVEVPIGTDKVHIGLGRIRQQSDEQLVIPLYNLPISYRVRDGLTTTFTDEGWLLVGR